ncbi:MAG: cupin [Gammaproteobacteria bacterium]
MTDAIEQIEKTFTVIKPDMGMEAVPVGPTLYPDLDKNFDQFRGHHLVSTHVFKKDWGMWECHPAGDELVVLLTGSVTFVLREGTTDRSCALTAAGQFVIVPRGIWHTARTSTGATVMFVTPGEGTRNAAQPED